VRPTAQRLLTNTTHQRPCARKECARQVQLEDLAGNKRVQAVLQRVGQVGVQHLLQPHQTNEEDHHIARQHHGDRTRELLVPATIRHQSDNQTGDDKANDVATSCTLDDLNAMGVICIDRQTDDTHEQVQAHREGPADRSQGARNQEHREGLSGDRHRSEWKGNRDLCAERNKQGPAEHEQCVGQQVDVGKHRSAKSVGGNTRSSHTANSTQAKALETSWNLVVFFGVLTCDSCPIDGIDSPGTLLMTDTVIRVLLVDDHRVLRTGLRLILDHAEGIECVGEAESAEDALHVSDRTHPDVVVMDVQMPGMGGIEGTRALRDRHPEAHVVMLSMFGAADDVRAAFAAGAQGYLIKTAAEEELVDALRAVAAGKRYLHPALGAALAQPAPPDPLEGLTDREREVLQLLALGYGNQEIAQRLHLSPRTVETHRANMMNKLRISSRADIVRIALSAGILNTDTAQSPT